jgi:hypothetical protein
MKFGFDPHGVMYLSLRLGGDSDVIKKALVNE